MKLFIFQNDFRKRRQLWSWNRISRTWQKTLRRLRSSAKSWWWQHHRRSSILLVLNFLFLLNFLFGQWQFHKKINCFSPYIESTIDENFENISSDFFLFSSLFLRSIPLVWKLPDLLWTANKTSHLSLSSLDPLKNSIQISSTHTFNLYYFS